MLAVYPFLYTALVPDPFVYRNLPFRVCGPGTVSPQTGQTADEACLPMGPNDSFHAGDVVPFVTDRCASNSFASGVQLPYSVSRNLRNADNGSVLILPDLATVIGQNECGRVMSMANALPDSVAPGHYFLEGVATVRGRLRTVDAYFRTDTFTVTR